MGEDISDRLGEVIARLDAVVQHLEANLEATQQAVRMMEEIHRAWCLQMEQEHRSLPEAATAPVAPGTRVSWTDPTDASNAAWGGKVEFVGVDAAGKVIAHVDFGGYGRRNLPVDQLIVGILT